MRRAKVDFGNKLREWDGFGVNYVEAAQTRDYQTSPQDYGGFSTLSEADRQMVLDLVFGSDGLKPGVMKMFLDPYHQERPGEDYDFSPHALNPAAYDHKTTTEWMRYFAAQGSKRTRARGDSLSIVTTLYGPPGWMTKQRFVRGRDLDPDLKYECAKYIISWVKYLRDEEDLSIKYISLHNEGESWARWPEDGSTDDAPSHDYNLYWPPEQVIDFLGFMREMLNRQGLSDVGLSPGETTNWYRFTEWGYADAIADDPEAIKNLGLVTSHGFFGPKFGRWFGDWRSTGIDTIRAKRPDIHSWVTSTSWSKMDVDFVNEIRNNIYGAKVNAIIPWAVIQRSSLWVKGDPNPGTAFRVDDQGRVSVEPGYYYYKQVCRAGQPGMGVARVLSNDSEIGLIGFARLDTNHPDAFVVLNLSDDTKDLSIGIEGTESQLFTAYRTGAREKYSAVGDYIIQDGHIIYSAPARSVTTFFAK